MSKEQQDQIAELMIELRNAVADSRDRIKVAVEGLEAVTGTDCPPGRKILEKFEKELQSAQMLYEYALTLKYEAMIPDE